MAHPFHGQMQKRGQSLIVRIHLAGTTPVPIPTANPAENYSWIKHFVLAVTGAGTTTMSNRNIYQSTCSRNGAIPLLRGSGSGRLCASIRSHQAR